MDLPPTTDPATRRRRRLRAARTLAGITVRTRLLPAGSPRRRIRLQVCDAANLLTALGVRVEVAMAGEPWPRAGGPVVSDHTSWVGDLAVTTALRGVHVSTGTPDDQGADVICAVAVRYRLEGRDRYLREVDLPRTVAGLAALPGLVVEVRRLPAAPGAVPAATAAAAGPT